MATAYVDSTPVALFTGSPHTYLRGRGLLQELEQRHVADNPRIFEPVVKEWWQPSRVDELPWVLHRAWNAMRTGRPGPVLLDVPMDVQAEAAEVTLPDPEERTALGRPRPDATLVERAAALLAGASRPVIVAGGGVISADATAELRALAERLGAPVVTTWNGKGAIDETHPLAGQTIGDTGSTIGNTLAANADVLLSVGCRFVDWSASSWRTGRDVRDPADAAHPARDRRARDRQELPAWRSRWSATHGRGCATCSTRSGAASLRRPTARRSPRCAPRGRRRSR